MIGESAVTFLSHFIFHTFSFSHFSFHLSFSSISNSN
jgi:hypothetical protein